MDFLLPPKPWLGQKGLEPRPRLSNPPPSIYPIRDQAKVDRDHLDLLAIFHFVGAGLALLGLAFVIAHYSFMHAVMTNPHLFQPPHGQNNNVDPKEFFRIFRFFYVAFGGWFVISLLFNVLGGIFLRARRHRTFCLIVAGINCLHIPLGTVLGVFTLVVLLRDSVRDLFAANQL